jgi:acetyl esterase/lipase
MLMSLKDPRWRFVLHMNWRAQMLPLLINGLPSKSKLASPADAKSFYNLPLPTQEQIASVSPYSQIVRNNYRTPTFLIHGTADDLIPWQQSQKVIDALKQRDVPAGIHLLDGVEHVFDTFSSKGFEAIQEGYQFLFDHV